MWYYITAVKNALVAQLDRVTGYEPVGRGFESLQARQKHRSRDSVVGAFLRVGVDEEPREQVGRNG